MTARFFLKISLVIAVFCAAIVEGAAWGQEVTSAGKSGDVVETIPMGDDLMPMEFVRVNHGTFMMGSPTTEEGRGDGETQHQVTLTHDFAIQITDVTQAQWVRILEKPVRSRFNRLEDCPETHQVINGSELCPNHPVDTAGFDIFLFANKVSKIKGLKPCYHPEIDFYKVDAPTIYSCEGYRLPTEAEWEYAARAGSTGTYPPGDEAQSLENFVVYDRNNPRDSETPSTADVASLAPNAWGLYDMCGEVAQWVQDFYEPLVNEVQVDPTGPSFGYINVVRGGSYRDDVFRVRFASRLPGAFWAPKTGQGFRLVRTLKNSNVTGAKK